MGCTASSQRHKYAQTFFEETAAPKKTTKGRQNSNTDPLKSILLLDDPRFECSANGRNGHELSDIYEQRRHDDDDDDGDDQQLLGEGQFGYVYRRYHVYTGQDVAVKRTQPTPLDLRAGSITTYDDVCTKCQEVRTLLKLRGGGGSRNILQLYEFFWKSGNNHNNTELNLVTELLGINLREWLVNQETFTEIKARQCATAILSGLEFMHRHNVVHRDIKEENVLFKLKDDLTSLKIVDLGFAKELTDRDERVRGTCGSLGYLAPEVYAQEAYGCAVDMFSFGVVLFRILSAEKPWPSVPSQATKEATMQLQYQIDKEQWLLVSQQGRDLVRQLLTYEEDRISAADAIRHAWLGDRNDSILQLDASIFFPGARARNGSRAIIEESTRTRSSAVSNSSQEGTRFWVDQGLQNAIARLMATGGFHGRVVTSQDNYMMLEEFIANKATVAAQYIASLDQYTELDCRNIFRQIALRIQAFHETGIAHRNLHLQNLIVEKGIGVDGFHLSVRGLQYAQLSSDDKPITGRVGRSQKDYGWFAFVAPEIDTEFMHDSRVDLWSLGAILYTLLCGVGPFTGSGEEIGRKKYIAEVVFEIVQPSPNAQSLVRGLLQVDPKSRLSVEEVLEHEWMNERDEDLADWSLDLALAMFGDWERRVR